MSQYTESVKNVAEFLAGQSERSCTAGNSEMATNLAKYADELAEANDHIARLEAMTSALPPGLGSLHDLPEALLSELSVTKTDELEDQLVTVINAYGDTASLDQILVGLFRKFDVVQKRRFIQNKLYRMTMVWSVSGKKGIYTTEEPAPEPEADSSDTAVNRAVSQTEHEDDEGEIPF